MSLFRWCEMVNWIHWVRIENVMYYTGLNAVIPLCEHCVNQTIETFILFIFWQRLLNKQEIDMQWIWIIYRNDAIQFKGILINIFLLPVSVHIDEEKIVQGYSNIFFFFFEISCFWQCRTWLGNDKTYGKYKMRFFLELSTSKISFMDSRRVQIDF